MIHPVHFNWVGPATTNDRCSRKRDVAQKGIVDLGNRTEARADGRQSNREPADAKNRSANLGARQSLPSQEIALIFR